MKRVPIYILLFALFPVLYAASANGSEVSAYGFVVAVSTALLATGACLLLAWGVLARSWQRAALITLLVVALFWSYDFLAEVATGSYGDALPLDSASTVDWLLSSACLLIVVLCGWRIRQAELNKIEPITTALNVGATLLLVTLGLQTLWNADANSEDHASVAQRHRITAEEREMPDIYYIILDGYARSDILSEYYGVNNELVSELRRRGFSVADASTSNYFWTVLSLTSSLNMDYVQSLTDGKLDSRSRQIGVLYGLIRNNAAARFLKKRNYQLVHLRSTWGATQSNEQADREIGCEQSLGQDEFLRALLDASWLRVLRSKVGMELAQCHQAQFAALPQLASTPGPKFVFAHFLLPHHPYLFDRDGTVLRHVPLSSRIQAQQRLWEDRSSYANQLLYVNREVIPAIDGILKRSRRPPIIIVQSDHGPNLRDGLTFQEQKRVRFANFAAFLLPGAPAGLVPGDVTPVNEFRYLFNHYFHAQFEILPTKRFYSEYLTPFAFEQDDAAAQSRPAAEQLSRSPNQSPAVLTTAGVAHD